MARKQYFDTVVYKPADFTTVGNRLKAAEFRGMVYNSYLLDVMLAMALTGREVTVNMKKVREGLSFDECCVFGEPLKQSVREKILSKIADKVLPNAHEAESEDTDRVSKYIKMVEEAEQTPAIENGDSTAG